MQKKDRGQLQQSSAWQESLKKQERNSQVKKYGLWAGIIAVSLFGLVALVKVMGTGSTQAPVTQPNLPAVRKTDIIIGNKNAKVTLTEYGDLQCPACASYNPLVNKVVADYGTKIRYVFRFFPLVDVHKNALISAQAAYAAEKQGKFDDMKNMLFDTQASWEGLSDPRDVFAGYAQKIGLDVAKFKTDMNSSEAKNAVLAGEKEALGLGLNSTPSFFIGNKYVVPQSYNDFKTYLDQELKKS